MLSFPSCVDNQFSSIQKAIKSLLRRYEERFLGTNVPSLFCPHQDMRMSDFTFETGKMSDEEYQFFHNGPDFTEVILYFLYACGFFSCASVLPGPWHLTFAARLLENLSFFFIEIISWHPGVHRFFSTGLPLVFRGAEPWNGVKWFLLKNHEWIYLKHLFLEIHYLYRHNSYVFKKLSQNLVDKLDTKQVLVVIDWTCTIRLSTKLMRPTGNPCIISSSYAIRRSKFLHIFSHDFRLSLAISMD